MGFRAKSVRLLFASCSALAFAGTAQAQSTGAAVPPSGPPVAPAVPDPTTGASTDAAAAQTSASSQDVIVTGSRVIQNGNNSPTPLTVISTQQLLQSTPTSIAAALQQLPVFQNSQGQNTGTGGGGAGPNGSANAPNIRSLGLYRNLVLFDGKRLQPSTDTGLTTIDMFPQMLLSRVDVVTGGVSAVYGSDAISGVVNFVTDRKFNGVSLKAQQGLSELDDDPIQEYGIAAGADLFGGRGHIEASLEYFDDPGIADMFSRRLGQLWQIEGSVPGSTAPPGSAANSYQLYSNVHNAALTFGGLIRSGALAGQTFNSDGVLTAFQHGTPTGTSGFEVGGDGAFNNNSSLKGSLRAKRAFGRFDFDVTDNIHFFVEGFDAQNRNSYNDTTLSMSNVTLRSQNPFLPAAYRYGTDTTTFTFSKILGQIGPHTKQFDLDSYYVNSGFEGKIGAWKWELGGATGVSHQNWTTYHNINLQHLSAALDAVDTGLYAGGAASGVIACRVTLSNPGVDPGCVPFNPFGPTAASSQAVSYLTDKTFARSTGSIVDFTGSITGSPFSTWAGPLGIALSAEWRRTGLSATSEIAPEIKADCTGLRYNCTQGTTNLHQVTFGITPLVHQTVKEVALEGEVPLLKNVRFVQDFSLNLAGRYADYDTSGHAWTWKAGGNWRVSSELLIRATRSRDFRAPNLNNLYGPATVGRVTVIDQLTGATLTNIGVQAGGNPDLKPEIGNTFTVGVVYKPQWLRGASVSVDYYDIKITNGITALNGSNVTVQNICKNSGGTSSLCDLIVRPLDQTTTSTANNATYFYSRSINASSIMTHGVDIETNYATRLLNRAFSVRVLATYQPRLSQDTPSIGYVDSAGYAYSSAGGLGTTPKWRVTSFVDLAPSDVFRISVSARWRSSLKWNTDPMLVYAEPNIPSFWTNNLNLSVSPKVGWAKPELYFNVQNLFNKLPPIAINSSADAGRFGAYINTDDLVGRYYTAGVRVKF